MSLNLVGQSLNDGTTITNQTGVASTTATAGRLLFAHLSVSRGTGTLTDCNFSAGWTKLGFQTGASLFNYGGALAYRYATGDANDDCQATFDGADCRFMLNILEDDSGITGTPQAFVSAGLDESGETVGCGLIAPSAQPATVFNFASVRKWESWMTNLAGDGMDVDSGFTKDYTAGQGDDGTGVLPGCASAHLDVTDLNAVNPVWSTNEGGSTACALGVIFSKNAVPTEWEADGIEAVTDQVGMTGEGNTATRLTCVVVGGTVIGSQHTVELKNNTTRWFIKPLIGYGDCSISIDGGASWYSVPRLTGVTWNEALTEMVGDSPRLAIKMHMVGDQIVIGSAELHPGMPASSVRGSLQILTTDEAVTVGSVAGEDQTGEWTS